MTILRCDGGGGGGGGGQMTTRLSSSTPVGVAVTCTGLPIVTRTERRGGRGAGAVWWRLSAERPALARSDQCACRSLAAAVVGRAGRWLIEPRASTRGVARTG